MGSIAPPPPPLKTKVWFHVVFIVAVIKYSDNSWEKEFVLAYCFGEIQSIMPGKARQGMGREGKVAETGR